MILSFPGIVTLVESLSLSDNCQNEDDEKRDTGCEIACKLYYKYTRRFSIIVAVIIG